MTDKNNMVCDLETGLCGPAGEEEMGLIDFSKPTEVISLYYVTDPICSHCWALEPALQRFIAQYGQYFNVKTVMGGLLESWEGFADVSNGISKASDVAGHWREVGEQSRMPIDGSLWIDNPVHSSYPPSRVYKIIQLKSQQLADDFLRKAREAVFVFNQNIADKNVLIELINQMGLEGAEIVKEASGDNAQQLLNEDFALARSLGVRGFPTIIMVNEENKGVKIVGARSFQDYADGLKQVLSKKENLKPDTQPALSAMLKDGRRLFSKEIEVMYDLDKKEVLPFVERELDPEDFERKEILSEMYLQSK
ncbi:DsbA family protein [Neobacillus notoginsengisoli]|uniref:DsbA family protein n=1 Tax=Neobacillus notoginsengisoli TaxID=1578198 RepID=A0A417YL45_9BACI|nr:DsbA family protein [Neobacillus notoginsengisoli]RHW33940.1 DsbA family protein [Neobacillus notoginsengisoli]